MNFITPDPNWHQTNDPQDSGWWDIAVYVGTVVLFVVACILAIRGGNR